LYTKRALDEVLPDRCFTRPTIGDAHPVARLRVLDAGFHGAAIL
jgi:hypothetical protein